MLSTQVYVSTSNMEKGGRLGRMAMNTSAIGSKGRCKGWVGSHMQMVKHTMASSLTTNLMVKDRLRGKMAISIWVTGEMACLMAQEA